MGERRIGHNGLKYFGIFYWGAFVGKVSSSHLEIMAILSSTNAIFYNSPRSSRMTVLILLGVLVHHLVEKRTLEESL